MKKKKCICAELILQKNNLDRNSFILYLMMSAVIQFAAGLCFHMCHEYSGGGVEMGTSSGQEGWWLMKPV